MTLIRRSNPFSEMLSLRQSVDRLFEDMWTRPRNGYYSDEHSLALDVRSTADAYEIEAALPGVKPEDVNISVLGDTLTITGSSRQDETGNEDGFSYREIRRGSFSRTVTLPSAVKADAANATFENGLLKLSIPKAEEAKPRQIEIKTVIDQLAQPAQLNQTASDGQSQGQ
jgi:HSP20 family protein